MCSLSFDGHDDDDDDDDDENDRRGMMFTVTNQLLLLKLCVCWNVVWICVFRDQLKQLAEIILRLQLFTLNMKLRQTFLTVIAVNFMLGANNSLKDQESPGGKNDTSEIR